MKLLHFRWPFAAVGWIAAVLASGCTALPGKDPSHGHIEQVGLVWLKNPRDRMHRSRIIEAVRTFARKIPEVQSASVGAATLEPASRFSDQSFDVCFVLRFPDEAARQRYNTHPVHQKAAHEVFLPLSRKLLFYRFVTE